MPALEMTNMVMVQDPNSGKVLIQDRVLSWRGPAFPGGHIEEDESFVDSAIREVKEETGLTVSHLHTCGVVHWLHPETYDRYLVFLYKTKDYSGELIDETTEGKNCWVDVNEIWNMPTENSFLQYLPMFLGGKYNEAFGDWRDGMLIYK